MRLSLKNNDALHDVQDGGEAERKIDFRVMQ